METASPDVDRATLTPIVRRVLQSDTAEVLDWRCVSIHKPFNQATGGVFRVSGRARDQGRDAPWSLVLKASGAGLLSDEPSNPQYWKREYLAYQSGFLADLPAGLRAPRCYGAEELPGREIRLWLEHVEDAHPGKWPPDLHLLAARQLGQFGGAYLTRRPLPDYRWLSRGFLEGYVAFFSHCADLYPAVSEHPLVRLGYPGDTLGRVMRLWDERERLEHALGRLPQTLCHHDAFRRNLLVRNRHSQKEVVAVDWAFAGIGAVGEDLDNLVAGSYWAGDLTVEEARELRDVVFESYLAGLRDAGWAGDGRQARLGYAAGTALRWSLPLVPLMCTEERWYAYLNGLLAHSTAETVEQYLGRMGRALPLWLDLGDEALSLMPLVN